ncbi:hypothetical protein RQP46_000046 [Phenoliferia psychrophenolica]
MSTPTISDLAALVQTQGDAIQTLSHRVGVAEDILELKTLHNTYGYYLDKCLYKQVADLFEEDGTVIFHGSVWRGMKGIRRLFVERFGGNFVGGKNGPIKGYLLDHLLLQQIVHVAPDRLSAKMRARTFMQAGRSRDFPMDPANNPTVPRQWWEGGIYENHFSRKSIDEPWKIRRLDYHPTYHGDYSLGWALTQPGWIDPLGPDEILPQGHGKDSSWIWPDTHTIPFHYNHPITGEEVSAEEQEGITIQEYREKKGAGANGK